MLNAWPYAPVLGWILAAAVFLALTWAGVARLDAAGTATHATREDPTALATRALLVVAAIASLGGVALMLVVSTPGQRVLASVLGVLSVAASWFSIHGIYVLRYAGLYYGEPKGGIDFNGDEPDYRDFAYFGFGLGMAYQVSDNAITSRAIRRTVLGHALLSYLLGAVVVAAAINLVSGLVAS